MMKLFEPATLIRVVEIEANVQDYIESSRYSPSL
jgi:hypothetical protein